ncbi:hypothetical protein BX666DRAFT_2017439 [Dichotomocladium elegans]|nr:hypothetical protein BX666DRAFT_2017439 [Dichotomocladium elegans]
MLKLPFISSSTPGFHTAAPRAAISRFGMPAMSPTMTEGTIHQWKVKEGESFSAGDILLELETDKAQIDVEASDDGVLARILVREDGNVNNGEKAAVNAPIALLAEEGDDLSNVEMPAEIQAAPAVEESKAPEIPKPVSAASTPTSSMDHHDLDTSKLKKPLSPAVLSLVLKHHIKDPSSIKASGPGGRLLKGDVLAHLGIIPFKPAPPFKTSAAPPREEIVFAKTEAKKAPVAAKQEEPVRPNFISKQVTVDQLLSLRQALNEQNRTNVSVNDFIGKAATKALQDTVAGPSVTSSKHNGVTYKTDVSAFSGSYKGGLFNVFHLSPPTYDFITDSYAPSKPYQLEVSAAKRVDAGKPRKSENDDMLDLIGFLGGEQPAKEAPRAIRLTTQDARIIAKDEPKISSSYQVEIKLKDSVPGKILDNQKAAVFLDRVEYYVRNPSELIA